MTRRWLLTWTTYGTWLPGDARGFVSPIQDESGRRVIHNVHGTPYDADMPRLRAYAQRVQKQPTVWLTGEQAEVVRQQFHETAQIRTWHLHAFAIMSNHVHLVVEADEELPASKLLIDFKAYTTRKLRALANSPAARFWTEKGSTRLLPHDQALENAVRYVAKQEKPLVVFVNHNPA